MTDHLGNVRPVVGDVKMPESETTSTIGVAPFFADEKEIKDYYPYGMEIAARCSTALTNPLYRFGYNGMEKDNEIKGQGKSLDYGARIYDPRSSRFLTLDPLKNKYSSLSPYQYGGDSPIIAKDKDGKSIYIFGSDPDIYTAIKLLNETEIGRKIIKFYENTFRDLYIVAENEVAFDKYNKINKVDDAIWALTYENFSEISKNIKTNTKNLRTIQIPKSSLYYGLYGKLNNVSLNSNRKSSLISLNTNLMEIRGTNVNNWLLFYGPDPAKRLRLLAETIFHEMFCHDLAGVINADLNNNDKEHAFYYGDITIDKNDNINYLKTQNPNSFFNQITEQLNNLTNKRISELSNSSIDSFFPENNDSDSREWIDDSPLSPGHYKGENGYKD